jgi:ribosomal RNA-processing protein 12
MSVDYDRSVTAGSRKTGSVKSGWTIGSDISCAFDATAFQHLRKLCNSSLESHRQICAVLAAVTEVIKSQGGSQTDMEYFAALMTALESANTEDMVTALTFLLNLVIGRYEMIKYLKFGVEMKNQFESL